MTEPIQDHSVSGARLLAWPAVRERVGISRTTAWRLQNAGAFPLPVVISRGRVGWREDEIEAWAESLRKRVPRKQAQIDRQTGPRPLRFVAPVDEHNPGPSLTTPDQQSVRPTPGPAAQLGFDF